MPDTRHLTQDLLLDETKIKGIVYKNYGIQSIEIRGLGGYSNRNYALTDTSGAKFVLRIARPNRSTASQEAEQYVLQTLAKTGFELAPRPMSQREKPVPVVPNLPQTEIQGNPRFIQLSPMLPGAIDCLWWQQCSHYKIIQIFKALAQLHRHMASIPLLQEKRSLPIQYILPEVPPSILQATPVGQYVLDHWQAFRQAAIRLQADISEHYPWDKARYQWIHGDIQLENLLFYKDQFSGFLDFERVSCNACELDVIFSAFRVCKEGNTDAPFTYDTTRFAEAINAYNITDAGLCPAFFHDHRHGPDSDADPGYEKYWKPFFCLDQAMVYLENAFDGIWQLAEGIGFLPCFNEVLHYNTRSTHV